MDWNENSTDLVEGVTRGGVVGINLDNSSLDTKHFDTK